MANLKTIIKTAGLGVALAAAGSVQAAPITVGGVTWDPNNPFDFESKGGMYEEVVVPLTYAGGNHTAKGFGKITEINTLTSFVCGTCELTYEFGDFNLAYDGGYIDADGDGDLSDAGDNPGTGNLVFTGGWIKFYSDAAGNYDPLNGDATSAMANDGLLWLDLAAVTDLRLVDGALRLGTLFGEISSSILGLGDERGFGAGFMDVVGGAAASNFDTNTFTATDGNTTYSADFNYTSTFEPTSATAIGLGALPMTGGAVIRGDSIPEPASLALLGAGLLGMGAAARRRRKAA